MSILLKSAEAWLPASLADVSGLASAVAAVASLLIALSLHRQDGKRSKKAVLMQLRAAYLEGDGDKEVALQSLSLSGFRGSDRLFDYLKAVEDRFAATFALDMYFRKTVSSRDHIWKTLVGEGLTVWSSGRGSLPKLVKDVDERVRNSDLAQDMSHELNQLANCLRNDHDKKVDAARQDLAHLLRALGGAGGFVVGDTEHLRLIDECEDALGSYRIRLASSALSLVFKVQDMLRDTIKNGYWNPAVEVVLRDMPFWDELDDPMSTGDPLAAFRFPAIRKKLELPDPQARFRTRVFRSY